MAAEAKHAALSTQYCRRRRPERTLRYRIGQSQREICLELASEERVEVAPRQNSYRTDMIMNFGAIRTKDGAVRRTDRALDKTDETRM